MTKRIQDRMAGAVKSLKPTIEQQRSRDVSEADTVTLVKDVLGTMLGYDKYAELTSEHAIRGTYCDIAVTVEGKIWCLIEVKSAGTDLDDRHVKQAIDYAVNKGVEWCILTNAVEWRLYNVVFSKPVEKHLVASANLLTLDPKDEAQLECLYLMTKEGFQKGAHIETRDRLNATSKYLVAALLVGNDEVIAALRRELRKLVDVKIDTEDIVPVLEQQVLKRDCLDGPEAEAALAKVARSKRAKQSAAAKERGSAEEADSTEATPQAAATPAPSPPAAG